MARQTPDRCDVSQDVWGANKTPGVPVPSPDVPLFLVRTAA